MRTILLLIAGIGLFGTVLGIYGLTRAIQHLQHGLSDFDAFSLLLYTNLVGGGMLITAVAGGIAALLDRLRRLEEATRDVARRPAFARNVSNDRSLTGGPLASGAA